MDRSILDPEAFLRTDVMGVHVLLEACRVEQGRAANGERAAAPRMLQVSTDEVYGSVETGASVEDDLPDDPEHVIISHNKRDAKVFDLFRVNGRIFRENEELFAEESWLQVMIGQRISTVAPSATVSVSHGLLGRRSASPPSPRNTVMRASPSRSAASRWIDMYPGWNTDWIEAGAANGLTSRASVWTGERRPRIGLKPIIRASGGLIAARSM